MDAFVAFVNDLLQFALQAFALFIKLFIYVLGFLVSLLQQLLALVS